MRNIKLSLFALLALIAFIPACGGGAIKTEGVTGTITLDGNPLPFASIRFIPLDGTGSESYGQSDSTGVYKLQTQLGKANAGTTPGKYQVAVTCYEEVGTGKFMKDEDGNEIEITEEVSALPAKYNDPTTSGIEVEVTKGSNKINLELVSE